LSLVISLQYLSSDITVLVTFTIMPPLSDDSSADFLPEVVCKMRLSTDPLDQSNSSTTDTEGGAAGDNKVVSSSIVGPKVQRDDPALSNDDCSATDDETDVSAGVATSTRRNSSSSTIDSSSLRRCRRKPILRTVSSYGSDSSISTTSSDATPESSPARARVSFDTIAIREYDQTIGDNPSVSYGPPISLDWSYSSEINVDLEDYETDRPPRRSLRAMRTNYYHRKHILSLYGHSEDELKETKRMINKAKTQRFVTKYFLPVMKVEDAITSAGRKAKRIVSPSLKEARAKEREFIEQSRSTNQGPTCSSRRTSI